MDYRIMEEFLKQKWEIKRLNNMLDFLIAEMPCMFDDCKHPEATKGKCRKCIRGWISEQVGEGAAE